MDVGQKGQRNGQHHLPGPAVLHRDTCDLCIAAGPLPAEEDQSRRQVARVSQEARFRYPIPRLVQNRPLASSFKLKLRGTAPGPGASPPASSWAAPGRSEPVTPADNQPDPPIDHWQPGQFELQ